MGITNLTNCLAKMRRSDWINVRTIKETSTKWIFPTSYKIYFRIECNFFFVFALPQSFLVSLFCMQLTMPSSGLEVQIGLCVSLLLQLEREVFMTVKLSQRLKYLKSLLTRPILESIRSGGVLCYKRKWLKFDSTYSWEQFSHD